MRGVKFGVLKFEGVNTLDVYAFIFGLKKTKTDYVLKDFACKCVLLITLLFWFLRGFLNLQVKIFS